MRKIGIVTVARSDYGIYRPILDAISASSKLNYGLFVSGAHLSPLFGHTITEIEADGRPIWGTISLLAEDDTPLSTAQSMGRGVAGFAEAFTANRPDCLLVLGDRFDMFSAACAAVPLNIPIAHIHGGEVTYGAIDEVFRHAITKMAHLHFPATEEYARRIRQMGEEAWRIIVSGAPSLDNMAIDNPIDPETLTQKFGIPFTPRPVIVTLHASTRGVADTEKECAALICALSEIKDRAIIITAPNADPGGLHIRKAMQNFVARHENAFFIESFGSAYYLSALANAAAVVGNSSSGLIETPSFTLPTVNIGNRQEGRTRAANVIDCEPEAKALKKAINTALSPTFRNGLATLQNPYGDGQAARRIINSLETITLDHALLSKRFADL